MKLLKYLGVLMLVCLISLIIAQSYVRPQQVKVMFIDWYDFEQDGMVYYRKDVASATIDSLHSIISQAEDRVGAFWGSYTTRPKIIYCDNDVDYANFGNPAMTPAVAFMSTSAYVVIDPSGLNVDVIAHELSHTELFARIGYLNRERHIPAWFDEGLAMQVDWRPTYSMDSLRTWSDGFVDLPDVQKMKTYGQFSQGDVRLNYSTAKYEVGQWYTRTKLDAFVDVINDGGTFREALEH